MEDSSEDESFVSVSKITAKVMRLQQASQQPATESGPESSEVADESASGSFRVRAGLRLRS